MAMIDLLGDVMLPPPPAGPITAAAFSTGAVNDAANEASGTIFQVPKTGSIRKVHWATRTVTTGATVDVRLETVDPATGFPSGTLAGTNTNINVVVGNGDDNVFFASTLTTDAAVTRGQILALVIAQPAVSFGNMIIGAVSFGTDLGLPYNALNSSGLGWQIGVSSFILIFAVEYDDGSIVPIPGITPPSTTITSTSIGTGTTPDVMGLRFQLPVAARVVGGWMWHDTDGDCDLKLVTTAYNQGAGTGILASGSIDKDIRRAASARIAYVYFTASVDLAVATNYRLVVEPTSATTLSFTDLNAPSLNVLNAWPGGQNFHLTSAKDPTGDGSWTNYNSGTFRMPLMGLMLRGVDDATGGGGGGTSRARVQRRM